MPPECSLVGSSEGPSYIIPGLKHGGVADETHRLISTPAFLLSLQGIQLPAKSSTLSSLPANRAESYYDRVLPLLRFLALVTQQGRNSEERGEEKASLTPSCCFHLSPPAPQFPLTLHQHHQCNTIVQIPLLQLISVSCDVIPQR